MFLGMVDDDIKNKKWSLGQTGGVAGPETSKKTSFFEAIRKKPKIEKIASKLVGITRRMY